MRDRILIRPIMFLYSAFVEVDGIEVFENIAPQGPKIYEKYIQQIGDTGFKSKVRFGLWESGPKAITIPLQAIEITCDKDFNQDFPSGSNLSSGFLVLFEYPCWVVKHNYTRYKEGYQRLDIPFSDFPYAILAGNLSSMNFKDKMFIGPVWICKLMITPQQTDEYVFTVKVTMSNGDIWEQKSKPVRLVGQE